MRTDKDVVKSLIARGHIELCGEESGAITSIGVFIKVVKAACNKRRDQIIAEISAVVKSEVAPLKERMNATDTKLDTLQASLDQNNLETARVDLNQATEHAPHEHKAILDLAKHYFVELGGNSWMWGKFKKWSEDEGVDISHITERVAHLR